MNERQIQELKDALRDVVALIAERGEPLNAETKSMLAQVMEHVANRIQELRREEAPLQTKVPEMDKAMPSSNIYGYNYDYDNGKLFVKFQGNDGAGNGPVYQYEGIPKFMFDLFRKGAAIAKTTGSNKWGSWWRGKTPSIGAAFYAFIRQGGYPYQRVT